MILTCLVPVLFTFYIQSVLKLKNNSGAKRLTTVGTTSRAGGKLEYVEPAGYMTDKCTQVWWWEWCRIELVWRQVQGLVPPQKFL